MYRYIRYRLAKIVKYVNECIKVIIDNEFKKKAGKIEGLKPDELDGSLRVCPRQVENNNNPPLYFFSG